MSPAFPNQTSVIYESSKSDPSPISGAVVTSTSKPEKAGLVVSKKSYRWNRREYSRNRRRIDIWLFVFSFLFRNWLNNRKWTYRGKFTPEKQGIRRRAQAIWIRENFLELGP
ncbi:MAG: AarF/ABC1/UbiB kinase family protein, partial [Pleurocapsa sp.]